MLSKANNLNASLNNEMQKLVEQIISGNYSEQDRNRLSRIMYPKLKFFISKYFSSADEVEEVLHNTLYKIFNGLTKYKPEYRFTTWIYTIAKNESLLHQYKVKMSYAQSIDSDDSVLEIVDMHSSTLDREIFVDRLYTATRKEILNLPDGIEKSILIDKDIHNMKGLEIAEKYSMNLSTVKTKLTKARKILRESVIKNNGFSEEFILEYI